MEFKRYYVPGSVEAGNPKVSHLRVRRATRRWFPTPKVIEEGQKAGYFSVADGKVTIKTQDGQPDVVYAIKSTTGFFCCHCNKSLNDSKEGAAHVASDHPGVPSPDDNNPLGWRCDNHWSLELVSGIEPKPEVGAAGRLRYFAQQETRRAAAVAKIQARDARYAAEAAAKAATQPSSIP